MQTTESQQLNVDQAELEKFSQLAHRWWDPNSEFRPLHEINPLRIHYIQKFLALADARILDVGCGGGILSEGMAQLNAKVTGIDLGKKALKVAKLHLIESGLEVDYQYVAVEDFADQMEAKGITFDCVTCMEMLEHVPDPASVVRACARLVKPGGHVFFSTLNRNPKSYLFAILGAEYLLNLLPKGTHDYAKFIQPAELNRFCREAGLTIDDMIGMSYNPLTKVYALTPNTDVNYIVHAIRD